LTLCQEAWGLLPVMFGRPSWPSRVTENGLRRLNYYAKHILVDQHGNFSMATEWITDDRDIKIV